MQPQQMVQLMGMPQSNYPVMQDGQMYMQQLQQMAMNPNQQ